jgi:hypothetical protein
MRLRSFIAAAGLLILPVWGVLAQLSSSIVASTPAETPAGAPATISVDLRQGHSITGMYILYRPFGSTEYRRAEMDLRGSTAQYTLPAERVAPPFLEYYFVLVDSKGKRESAPPNSSGDPFTSPPAQPFRLSVQDKQDSQILFLSPEQGATLDPDDVVISLSLLRADSTVVLRATQLKLDDQNITPQAVFSGDLIVYVPGNHGIRLSPGRHSLKVGLFTRTGRVVSTAELTFSIRRSSGDDVDDARAQRGFDAKVNVQAESRHETISNEGQWYNRAGMQFRGTTDIWTFTSNLFFTSDEKAERQPQNRYFFGVETPWVKAGYGDHYPTFPDLVLSGKRVRGLQTTARFGVLGLDLTLGEINRATEGTLLAQFPADSFSVEFHKDSTAAFGPVNPTTWGKYSFGTYTRKLFAVRPSMGNRETWEVGFTWLSSKDDPGSIRYGIRPKENILVGTDFLARFDRSRIELNGQAAFSAYNSDISSGTFSDAYIDTVFQNPQGIKEARDRLKDYITVNDNFRPLNMTALATLAYEANLGLHYFNNDFTFTYLSRGSDYVSFGQSFLQTDLRGFKLLDRARLVDNQLFCTLGYERLEDNLNGTKPATTVFSNMNIAATYFPRRDLPTVTVGFARFSNDNGLAVGGRDSLAAVNDGTNRFYLQSSYDFRKGAQHTATLNLSTSQRSDETVRQYDVNNFTVEAGLTSQYGIPLRTMVSIALNLNTLPDGTTHGQSSEVNYTALSFHADYAIIRNVFNILATIAPTLGDYRRTALDVSGEWFVRPDMSLVLQLAYYKNDTLTDDSIVSLRYRFTL